MKCICQYCDSYVEDTEEICPHCGAVNAQYKRQGNEVPRTIEELKQWYEAHRLPPEEVTRFFIGKDYKGPKAFGIYRDGERVIVYKNKSDGSRAIRYDGNDEAYAVNEIYLKLKERIAEEKAKNSSASRKIAVPQKKMKRNTLKEGLFYALLILGITAIVVMIAVNTPDKGYYSYGGDRYYYLDDDWYIYNSYYNAWERTTVDEELSGHYSDYYDSDDYSYNYGTSKFEDTSYYSDWESSRDNDWDSDSTWDGGSWDSDGGSWDSDW